MKKAFVFLFALCLTLALAACGQSVDKPDAGNNGGVQTSGSGETEKPSGAGSVDTAGSDETTDTTEAESSGTLVVYFSCTGNTKAVAEKLAELSGADIYEIVPSEPYTSDDLNYNNNNCRANREMNDENSRPAIGSDAVDLSEYDTIIIGYPIWWGTMPRIINTFLDTYDLSGKVILPFCTSGGSGVSRSVSDIKKAEPDADVRDGIKASGANDKNLAEWLENNDIEFKITMRGKLK